MTIMSEFDVAHICVYAFGGGEHLQSMCACDMALATLQFTNQCAGHTQRNFNMQCTDDSGEYDGDYDLYASDTDESEGEIAVAHAKDAPEWMPINGVQFSERDRSQWPHTACPIVGIGGSGSAAAPLSSWTGPERAEQNTECPRHAWCTEEAGG